MSGTDSHKADAARASPVLRSGASQEPSDTFPLPATGKRVRLRALRASDLEAFHGYRSDHDVSRYQGWLPISEADAAEFIHSMENVKGPARDGWIQLGIALEGSDLLVGDVGLFVSEGGDWAEIGISFAKAYQGNGLASEALELLIALVFGHTPCQAIRGVADARNLASRRLVERRGFAPASEVDAVFRGESCVEITYVLAKQAQPVSAG